MATHQRKDARVYRQGVGNQVVEIGGNGRFVLRGRHQLRQHGIAEAGFAAFHGFFQKRVTLFLVVAVAALIDERIEVCGVPVIEILDTEIFRRRPLLNGALGKIFQLMQFLEPLRHQHAAGRYA